MQQITEARRVVKRLQTRPQQEGAGAVVRRSIGRFDLKYFDPFLVLDEFSISAPGGFLDHPHRGFEAVTYMLQGALSHEDSEGHKGTIKAGDLQWMTAGRGIIHSETPATPHAVHKGLQLWINLPSTHKMIAPMYQEIASQDIPETTQRGIKVRVISGQACQGSVARSQIHTITPTVYLDVTLPPGSHLHQSIPTSYNAFVYVLEGEGIFGTSSSSPASAHQLLLLGRGDGLEAWNRSEGGLRFILVGGEPLGDPVAQFGPFVMNTDEEIDQTIEDFEKGVNGFEKAHVWKSQVLSSLLE
uniref:Pirin n=1 Tax=Kalanchoe fedtschenkoi TaxID=63787 RepID=A0A7N0U351_KALFE